MGLNIQLEGCPILPDDEVYPLRFRDIDGKIKIYPLRKDVAIDLFGKDHKERNKKWD